MFIFRRILLFLNPIVLIVSLELIRNFSKFWWLFLLANFLLLLVTLWEFSQRKINIRFANFLIAPLIFVLSVFAFLMFYENVLIYRFVYVLAGVFVYLYLDQTLNYFYFTTKYQPYTLENLSLYINVLSVFFLSIPLFSSLIFLRLNLLFSALLIYLVIFVLTHQIYWSNKMVWAECKLFCLGLPLLVAEVFLVISYLPLSFYVNALLVSMTFYVFVSLSRQFLLKSLDKKTVWQHVLISIIAVLLILITAQWG